MLLQPPWSSVQVLPKTDTHSALFWDITQRRVVILCHSTLRNIPEERGSDHHGGGSLKSRMIHILNVKYHASCLVKRLVAFPDSAFFTRLTI
jgi:hypothetical protein